MREEKNMNTQRIALALFWIGLLFAVVFAGIGTWSLTYHLRTLTAAELANTLWTTDGPMFLLWAFAATLGSLLAAIGAFIYVKTRRIFVWLTPIGVLVVVFLMVMVFSRVYYSWLFGIGGILILLFFFAIVWLWMKKYAALEMPEKIAGSFKLIGYVFWLNATWFLCGEFGSLHQKAFEGKPAPSPIEIMVCLVLGWFFVLLGEYQERQLRKL
jgi:hypothetical protein